MATFEPPSAEKLIFSDKTLACLIDCTPIHMESFSIFIIVCLCLGAQSFEHANVLSEKINFSALGGPGVAIFGPDDLHPMY